MDYNELAKRCHQNAVKHGFWRNNPSNEHCLMLVITEIAEMVEADRKGKYAPKEDMMKGGFDKDIFEKYYKDTVEDEMADAAIRLLDFSGNYGLEIDFNDPDFKNVKIGFVLKSITENAFTFCRGVTFHLYFSICLRHILYLYIIN